MQKATLAVKIFFLVLFFSICCGYAQIKPIHPLKIALLDTPYNEIPLNLTLFSEYEKAYLAGIETAAHVARKYNIDIQYKAFFYGHGSLDILGEIPKIQKWEADLVIGPSSSDQFTLLRDYLPDTVVLSSYASGEMLKSLPKNFYSVFLPDRAVMTLLSNYVHKKFPEKNIYIISQADCKQCVGVSKLFIAKYKMFHAEKKIVETKTIMDNIDTIDSKKLIIGHEDDVILVFNDTFYAYNTLIKHIASAFPNKHMIFFSDQDNWGSAATSTPNKNIYNYESYRIGPLLLEKNESTYKDFSKSYYEVYHTKPFDAASYMTYVTVMSAIEALKKYPAKGNNISMRKRIMYSYLSALKNNPDWFRVNDYGIYLLTPKGEILDEKTVLN